MSDNESSEPAVEDVFENDVVTGGFAGKVLRTTYKPPASMFEGAATFGDLMDAIEEIAPGLTEAEPRPGTGYAWFRRQIKRFTYKPGWKFDVFPADGRRGAMACTLVIAWKAIDSYDLHRERTVEVQSIHPLYSGVHDRDPDDFAAMVAAFILSAEAHESREWLSRDGKIWDNPHG